MSDVTVASFEEMEPIYEGLARRARATLGVTAFGMQVMSLPPEWEGYPDHHHDATMDDANQEEVYIPIAGSATLVAGEERFELRPGMMARVGPEQRRRILPGPRACASSRSAACRARSIPRRGRSSVGRFPQGHSSAVTTSDPVAREARHRA